MLRYSLLSLCCLLLLAGLGPSHPQPAAFGEADASAARADNNAPRGKGERGGALTFSRDIAPIIFQNCASCHRPGEVAPFSLLSYEDVKKRATQIALVTHSRLMPPWRADAGNHFQGERRLTDAQVAQIKQWAEGGAQEGKRADLPPLPHFAEGWPLGKPDLIVSPAQDYKLAAEGRDMYRCYVVPTHFDEDRYVSAIDARPGNRAVTHHIIAYVDTTGKARELDAKDPEVGYQTGGGIGFLPSGMLGGWAPGAVARNLPEGTGFLLPKGADIVLETHYHRDGKPETDRPSVALYFTRTPATKVARIAPLLNFWFRLPPGEKNIETRAALTAPADATLLTIFPHMHLLGRDMTVTVTPPNGTSRQLIHVPDWDFNWQGFYAYQEPIKIARGSKIELVAHYDNSTDNPRNPNSPPRMVKWGEQTTDEMCLCYLGFTVDAEPPAGHPNTSTAKK